MSAGTFYDNELRYAIEVIANDRKERWEAGTGRLSTDNVTDDEYKLAKALLELSKRLDGPNYRELLIRAVAYLPVPATVSRGESMGVMVPDPNCIPAVEKLRREIHAALNGSPATGEKAS